MYVFHVVSIALVVIWLKHLSPTDGQDLAGLLGCPPCSFVIPCAVLTWSIEEDIQSLTAPQEHNYETLACRYAGYVEISSLKMQSK